MVMVLANALSGSGAYPGRTQFVSGVRVCGGGGGRDENV